MYIYIYIDKIYIYIYAKMCIYLQMHDMCIYILFTYAEFLHLFCILSLHLCDITDSSAAVITSFVPRFYAISKIK